MVTSAHLNFHFDGLGGADTLTVDAGTVHLLNDANLSGTSLTINVTSDTTDSNPAAPDTVLEFDSQRQHLAALNIGADTEARLQVGLAPLLRTAALSVDPDDVGPFTGTLDVGDGFLIVAGGDPAVVTTMIASGINGAGGVWTGSGITSGTAAADTNLTLGVGVLSNDDSQFGGNGDALYNDFADETVDAGDVLVRFTYFGDADLTGRVDSTDYGLLDSSFNSHAANVGWVNGDLDYNGSLDITDYFLIDHGFNTQGLGRLEPKTRQMVYTSQWQVAEERKAGLLADQYVWSPVYVDAMVERDRDTSTVPDGTLDERTYVQQDANFNVTSITDDEGGVVERYEEDAYGTVTVLAPGWSERIGGSEVQWVYLNQGMRYDAPAQVYINHGRLYSAILGRPISKDQAGYVDGMNLYQRERSSPVDRLDPSGLDSMSIGGFGGGGFDWQTDRATGGLGFDPATGEHRSIYDLDASGQIWPGGIFPSDGGTASGDFWNSQNINDIINTAERMARSRHIPTDEALRQLQLLKRLGDQFAEGDKNWWTPNYQCQAQSQALNNHLMYSQQWNDELTKYWKIGLEGGTGFFFQHNVILLRPTNGNPFPPMTLDTLHGPSNPYSVRYQCRCVPQSTFTQQYPQPPGSTLGYLRAILEALWRATYIGPV